MSEFIKMRKGNEIIAVHQMVVNAHIALGWAVVVDEPVVEKPVEPAVEAPAPKSRKKDRAG